MPREADLAAGVAAFEESGELGAAVVVEAFAGLGEQSSRSVERVVLVAAVAEGLMLDSAADLVEAGVGQLHQVERIGHLGGVGQHRGERNANRHGPDRSNVAQLNLSSHACSRPASHSHAPAELRLGITSRS